jgi:hypothetical protein
LIFGATLNKSLNGLLIEGCVAFVGAASATLLATQQLVLQWAKKKMQPTGAWQQGPKNALAGLAPKSEGGSFSCLKEISESFLAF